MIPAALIRGLHLAAVLSLSGALLQWVAIVRPALAVAPPAAAAALHAGMHRLVWGSLLLGLVTGALWLMVEAASMGGDWHLPIEPRRWHLLQATEAEQDEAWFAAAFHLTRLLAADPDNAELLDRRAR